MIPSKYQDTTDNIKQLFEWGDPRETEGQQTLNEWEDYLPYGFSSTDVPQLIALLNDRSLDDAPEDSNTVWVTLYAWRILGQLKSVEAIESLLDWFEPSIDDEWALSEIPSVLGMIGKPALPSLSNLLFDESESEIRRTGASESLAKVAESHPELRDEVLAFFGQYLESPSPDFGDFNSLLTCNLIDLKAIELIDGIRRLYENEYANIAMAGDIEDVEIALGLRVKRATPKPNYNPFPGLLSFNDLVEASQETFVRDTPKVGRNDPCPCGSGKKYKKCCLNN